MSRPVSISDDVILAAAREVFLAHGVRGTSADVAARARVSEGSIFKRWPTKEQLFHAAMSAAGIGETGFIATLPDRVGRGDLREHLVEIGMAAIDLYEKIVPLHMHSWAGRGGHESPFDGMEEPPPLAARKRLASYLEAERRAGRLRNVDPDVMGRAFMGALYNFVALEIMLRGRDPHPMPASTFVRGLVDILLRGAAPDARRASQHAAVRAPRPKKKTPARRK